VKREKMMDRQQLAEQLGVHPYGMFWVKDIHLFGWGHEVILYCLYEPGAPADPVPFQITLNDCRELQWRVYAHLQPPDDRTLPATSIVNIHTGTDQHRKPLHILTDAFGLSVSYGTLAIEMTQPPG
jgi:hypothetical protein